MQRALFLDRDGTLIHPFHHPTRPEQMLLYEGLGPALHRLQDMGFLLILITNQSGLARGYFTPADLERMHDALCHKLAQLGVRLDDIYYCPHHPDGVVAELARECECRKPRPGLLLQSARKLGKHPYKRCASGVHCDTCRRSARVHYTSRGGKKHHEQHCPDDVPDYRGSARYARAGRGTVSMDECWRTARKVLLVRLDNLGDVLLATPAFHAVKVALPEAALTLLTSPVGAQVGRLNPDLDDVIVYQAPWVDPWQQIAHDSAREKEMITRLQAEHFDGAIIFTSFRQSALPAAYLCYLANIPLRAAASIDGAGSLLTTRHKHPERVMHEVERGLDLIGALGMQRAESDLVLRVPSCARTDLAQFLATRNIPSHRPLIVVHPGCSMPARTYPWERYAEVVKELVTRLDAFVVLTGADDERELAERVRARLAVSCQSSTCVVAGALTFPMLCALIERAHLTITNNTGPMHISAALKTPVVVLFALTNPPEQWGPWQVLHRQLFHDVSCRICYSRICPYQQECLSMVTPAEVVEAAQELLREASTVRTITHAKERAL